LNRKGTTEAPSKQVEISYWGLWEPSEIFSSVINQFQEENPNITVNYQQQSYQNYRERLQNALSSDSGPDVFRFHHTWVPMLEGNLDAVPSDIYSQSAFEETFYPIAASQLKSDGAQVGIPLMIDGLALYYNQAMFDRANLTPPTNWDELRRVAKMLTLRNENEIIQGGIALGTTGNVEHFSDILGLMLLQNSADPSKPNNQLGQDALTFYTIFYRTDKVWDETLPSSTYAFATEKAAMMIAPSWRAHDVHEINPDLQFATAPVPQLPDTNITWATFWAEGVSSSSSKDKKQAAWLLLQYLSQKEVMRQLYSTASDSPGRLFGEPFSRIDLADQLITDPLVGSFVAQAPQAESWFMASFTHDNGLNDKNIKYYQDAINAMNQGESAQDALEAVEAGVQQVLNQYQVK
jgi:multiple sugar transport system substrate-binding protein